MEELIDILDREEKHYQVLLGLSREKTGVIVDGNIEKLQEITGREEAIVSEVAKLDKKREELSADIANVMNMDQEKLKLTGLIQILEKRPQERDELIRLHDALRSTLGELSMINDQNRALINQSLDMIEFNLSLTRSMRTAPETGNYTRKASIAGDYLGESFSGFDAKQ